MNCLLAPASNSTGRMRRAGVLAAGVAAAALAGSCASRSSPGAGGVPPPGATLPDAAIQQLYESGRYDEVVSRVAVAAPATATAEAVWFAGHSSLRLGRRDEAASLFARIAAVNADPGWQVTSQLALSALEGNADAMEQARRAAEQFPGDPFVQFELGLATARNGDFAAAVQAFDRTVAADPAFAYAYYYAGLAYDRLNRADLTVSRFDIFVRLAPQAPERPEVEAILNTVRRR